MLIKEEKPFGLLSMMRVSLAISVSNTLGDWTLPVLRNPRSVDNQGVYNIFTVYYGQVQARTPPSSSEPIDVEKEVHELCHY